MVVVRRDRLTAEVDELADDSVVDIGDANFGRIVGLHHERTAVDRQIGVLDFHAVIAWCKK